MNQTSRNCKTIDELRGIYLSLCFQRSVAIRPIVIPNYEWVTGQGKRHGPRVKCLKIVPSVEWKPFGWGRVTPEGVLIGGNFKTVTCVNRRIWNDIAFEMCCIREVSQLMCSVAILEAAIESLTREVAVADLIRKSAVAVWNLSSIIEPPVVGIERCDRWRSDYSGKDV